MKSENRFFYSRSGVSKLFVTWVEIIKSKVFVFQNSSKIKQIKLLFTVYPRI